MSKEVSLTRVFHCLCAALLIALLILQFSPYWTYGEAGETASLQSYVWWPNNHAALDSWLGSQVEGYSINSVLAYPILSLLLSVVGAVVCLFFSGKGYACILPILIGATGVWSLATNAALRLGSGWGLHLAVCLALLVLGVAAMVSSLKRA